MLLQSGSLRSPILFLPHLHVPALLWASALWGQLLLLGSSTATNPAGNWAVELQMMGRAKTPWLCWVWQCHGHYSTAPTSSSTLVLNYRSLKDMGPGWKPQQETAFILPENHLKCQNLESSQPTALWATKQRSPSLFKALKWGSLSVTPHHQEICRVTLTPSLAPEACTIPSFRGCTMLLLIRALV